MDAYGKKFGILRSPLTTTYESRGIVYKGYWRYSGKTEGSIIHPCYSRCGWALSEYST